jgi:hypothetical protein
MGEYRYVGETAAEISKGEARVQVGMGDFIELSDEELKDPSAQELTEAGLLISTAPEPEAKAETKTTKKTEGGG